MLQSMIYCAFQDIPQQNKKTMICYFSEKRKADSDQVEPAKKPKLDELDKSLRKIRKMDRKDIENLLKVIIIILLG